MVVDEISYTIPQHAKIRKSREAHESRRDRTRGPGAAFDSFLLESRVLPTREQSTLAPIFALAETQLTPIKDYCKPPHAPHEVTRCAAAIILANERAAPASYTTKKVHPAEAYF